MLEFMTEILNFNSLFIYNAHFMSFALLILLENERFGQVIFICEFIDKLKKN